MEAYPQFPPRSNAVDPPDALRVFTGIVYEPSDITELRMIRSDGEVRSSFHRAADLSPLYAHLLRQNRACWNIYIAINPRCKFGARGDKAVGMARVAFADFDNCSTDDARRRLEASGLPAPAMLIFSGHGVHGYWTLNEPMTDLPAWSELQKDLAAHLRSDPKVHNPERLMRLPGFRNHKPPPADAYVISAEPALVTDFTILRERCPNRPVPMQARHDSTYEATNLDVAEEDRIRRCQVYLGKLPASVSGQGGHDALLRAACTCIRFGLRDALSLDLLTEYNRRSDPPWTEREIQHKLADAHKLAGTDFGRLLIDRHQRPKRRRSNRRYRA
jgi:hypothetical protein